MDEALLPKLPSAVRLERTFDPERLRADLREISDHQWKRQRYFSEAGLGTAVSYDWTVLPLRSPGGSADRTDPGGPGLLEYRDTPWLARTPYFAEALDAIPAPKRAVRLMALGPGAATRRHNDTKYGFPWGALRLHIPLVTLPEAILEFDGPQGEREVHCWQPGTLWFGNFCRPHRISNTGDAVRVHLVIDTYATPELVELFPEELRGMLTEPHVRFVRPERPLGAEEARGYQCAFALPRPFADWEDDEEFLTSTDTAPAAVAWHDGQLVLEVDGTPTIALVHVGDGEFRFRGWTDERALRVDLAPSGEGTVTLLNRCGETVRSVSRPAAAR